jgi:acetyl esterase/lipase
MILKTTHIYKTVGGLELLADVFCAEPSVKNPVLVWLHGGALIFGGRDMIPEDVRRFCEREGVTLVSLDYRLAPETRLPDLLGDIRDGLRWIHTEGPTLFQADTSKIVIAGNSAGGYLTLRMGLDHPRPIALISYWGYGDIDGSWYTQPSENHRTGIPLIAAKEALTAVGDTPISHISPDRPDLFNARIRYYLYLRQNGLWTREVTGYDPETEKDRLLPYSPIRHISPDYPPTFLIHGIEDRDVPFEKSALMAQTLSQYGVSHEFVPVPGAGHELEGGDPARIRDARQKALTFISKNM